MLTLWHKLRWSFAHRGIRGTVGAVLPALVRPFQRGNPQHASHPFDQRYGVETSGVIGGGALATGHAHDVYITAYAGIAPSRFNVALERWRETLDSVRIEDCTFVDLGCGKGRALMLASLLPFREAIGVELNPQLVSIASSNVQHWLSLGEALCPLRVETGDALAYSPPPGRSVFFFYSSFGEPLVRSLASRISQLSATQPIDLIYQSAASVDAFSRELGFRELWRGVLAFHRRTQPQMPLPLPSI